jgi:adenylate cyclase
MTLGRIRLIGIAAALVTAALLSLAGPLRTSQPVFDRWQTLAPRDLTDTPVRIVWIDDKAVAEHGRWPWPRRLTSLLLNRIGSARPKVIGLDMVFSEPDLLGPQAFAAYNPELPKALSAQINALPDYDQELANTIGLAPVIVGRVGVDAVRPRDAAPFATLQRFATPLPPTVKNWPEVETNLDAIDGVALGHGLMNGEPDADGIVRRVPLVAKVAGSDATGLALELTMAAKDLEAAKFNGAGLTIGTRTVATQPDGTMAMRLGSLSQTAQVSAFDVFDNAVSPDTFKDKIVIVAVSAAGTSDQVATVIAPAGYGATVQANAVDTILRGGELIRPAWLWIAEGLITFGLVFLAVRVLPLLSIGAALGIGFTSIAALFGGSFIAYAFANTLFDPIGPSATALATSLTMLLLLFARSRQLLAAEKLATASAQGELNAARAIQLGMLPPAEALAALDPRVTVSGLIEPAKSIGGDFFDAMRTGPDTLCFLVGDVSGKGVPAALFMALSKALTKSALLRDGASLADTVAQINADVSRDNSEDMFVTLLAALLDVKTGALTLSSAGHEYPWVVRAHGIVEMIKPSGGPPLGVAPDFPYGESTAALSPGDTLVILSDGITEARTPRGSFFDHDRVQAILAGWEQKTGTDALCTALRDAVRVFEAGEDATDDLTVLAVRYEPI